MVSICTTDKLGNLMQRENAKFFISSGSLRQKQWNVRLAFFHNSASFRKYSTWEARDFTKAQVLSIITPHPSCPLLHISQECTNTNILFFVEKSEYGELKISLHIFYRHLFQLLLLTLISFPFVATYMQLFISCIINIYAITLVDHHRLFFCKFLLQDMCITILFIFFFKHKSITFNSLIY